MVDMSQQIQLTHKLSLIGHVVVSSSMYILSFREITCVFVIVNPILL